MVNNINFVWEQMVTTLFNGNYFLMYTNVKFCNTLEANLVLCIN